ncbi:MAG: preprotein translocase subunit SecG [Acidobacteria bacterium]|nr:MAG: preprotein translocase subunit SecG [Acidobacteriota bacterium]PYQ83982.1 MAG: preprotein translocase subunit SecG [Acidobacteriota bacterium]PYR07863.1 MAG: preprotein translocase subunit SecG [Acidobacteriota bacterium]PYR14018.1 MAG: preprotein translocase subunit SecG [Acidobacteriota bacterium]
MILYYLLSALYVLVCILLLLVILMQQGKGDMAAAFGGGSSQSAFGARAGATVLSKATTVLAVLFMLGALALAIMGQKGPGSLMTGTAAPPVKSAPAAPAPKPVTPPTGPQQPK